MKKDALFVLPALLGLLLLGLASDRPLFEALSQSRLTYFTALGLPLVVALAFWRRPTRVGNVASSFAPILACAFVYENLKHLHANRITEWLGIAPKDALMLRVDEALFGRALPLVVEPLATPLFTQVMWAFYVGAYYAAPFLALSYAYFVREDDALFLRVRRAIVFCLLGGYVLYLLVPVAGPLFLIGERFARPIGSQVIVQRLAFDTLRYNWDCFPSLHTALPWLLVFVLWRTAARWLRGFGVVVACGVTLSTVVLRFHYGIDLIAGVIWAALVGRFSRSEFAERPVALPIAPSAAHVRPVRKSVAVLALLFVATGGAGLLSEQVFERLLSNVVGATTPTATLVLAIYFAGLTLGAWAYGRFAPRVSDPARIYAMLEGAVALWALGLYAAHDQLADITRPLLAAAFGTAFILPARAMTACLWILPPSLCMGATFPAVVDILARLRVPRPKTLMALFYALNLVGALGAALAGPYLLLPRVGLDGTLLWTFAIDGLACVMAIRAFSAPTLARRLRAVPALTETHAPVVPGFRLVLAVSFLSGFVFFALEVLWTHLLGAVIGNTIYAFAAMLGLVLAALTLGGLVSALANRGRDEVPLARVAFVLALGAVLLAVQHRGWPSVPHRLAAVRPWVSSFTEGELARWQTAFVQVVPAALVLGMVYPSLFRLREFPSAARAAYAGLTAAANAIGCILGALVTGFVLLPRVGSERTELLLAAATAIGGGSLSVIRAPTTHARSRLYAGALLVVAVAAIGTAPAWDRLALTSGEHVYFSPHHVFPETKLLFFHEDTLGGMTTVVENPAGTKGETHAYRTLLTNGKFQGNDAWERDAQIGFALIPSLHVAAFDRACVIGLGTGQSAQVSHAMGFRDLDVAEIAPGILRGAHDFFGHVNGNVLDRPNVHVFLEDGRNVLFLGHERYDLITMELSSVWFAGVTSLYSAEFYRLARQRLRPGGVVQQWIQLHHIEEQEVASVLATMTSTFPHVSFWVFGGQGVAIGSEDPQRITRESLERFVAAKTPLMMDDPGRLFAAVLESRLLAPEEVKALVAEARPTLNTDRNRYLEYSTPRHALSRRDHVTENVTELARYAKWQLPALPADAPPELVRAAQSAEAGRELRRRITAGR